MNINGTTKSSKWILNMMLFIYFISISFITMQRLILYILKYYIYLDIFIYTFQFLLHSIDLSSEDMNIQSNERDALYDLYNYTNGNQWIWKGEVGHWNFTDRHNVNPCSSLNPWQGLRCTIIGSYNHISSVNLTSYNLNGTLPHSMGQLKYLTILDLSSNHLNGELPSSIGNFKDLVKLNVSTNLQLNGFLPKELYYCTKLQTLIMKNNSFTG